MLSVQRHTRDTIGEREGVSQYAMGMAALGVVQSSSLDRQLTPLGSG